MACCQFGSKLLCWLISNLTPTHEVHWNLNQNTMTFSQKISWRWSLQKVAHFPRASVCLLQKKFPTQALLLHLLVAVLLLVPPGCFLLWFLRSVWFVNRPWWSPKAYWGTNPVPDEPATWVVIILRNWVNSLWLSNTDLGQHWFR